MKRDDDPVLDDPILSEAVRWHLAEAGDAMDWEGFTRWLEADPHHREAYDQVALTALALDDHRAALAEPEAIAEPPARPAFGRRLRWGGAAIAATLAAALVIPQVTTPAAQVYETAGTARRIVLDDGSAIVLAPRSRLSVGGRAQDKLALSGGALFDVRHDPDRTMAITAGEVSISDIGTRFDVQAQDRRVRVAVVEGKVQVSADALDAPIRLAAGKGLDFDGEAGRAVVAAVRTQDVGAWQQGRLSYEGAPLALVAADLRRYAGVVVEVPASLRNRRFSGTLVIDDGDAALRDLAQLMGLRLGGRAGAWRLEQPAR